MSKIEEFYNALIKDPDLEIRGGQTREQAAMQEAEHRARQYNNNAQALAMATDVSKSPINALLDFVSKEYKGVSDEGIKAIHENMPEHGPQVKQRKPVRLPNPDVPEEKKSKKKESTAFTGELVTTRPADATGEFTQETKYKTINKPATTSKVKNLIDTVYQRAEESNLSEEDTQNLINETFNNPDYYTDKENLDELRTLRANVNSVNDSKRSSKIADPPEYEIKFVGGTRGRATEEQRKNQKEVRNLIDDVRQRAENDNLSEEETQNLINETLNDAEILAPVGGFTPAKPTIARREKDGHIERYSAAKETLGNTKPEKAIWETEGPEQNQFNGLAPEIKQILNNIHSEANSNSKLTAAQQTVLLDIFDDESSGGAIRGIHDAIRDPDTGDWKTANDLTSGEADKILAYSELEEANLQVRNKNVKDIAGKALERLGNNSETLELSDTQLNHIQDRISGENIDNDISMGQKDLETASAEPQEAIPDSEYPYKSQLEGGQKSTNTSKNWLDNAKKFLFPGQSKVSNDVLASKLQSMANDGHFEADNPIYDGVTGAKSEGSQHTKIGDAKVQNASAILTLFNNDHEAFSSYKATPNQANETEKNIRANKKAEIAVTNDPSDSKKQKEAIKTKEKVIKDKAGDNQNENNENDKKDLKDLSNIEIKDNESVVDDQNKKTEENIQTVIEKPETGSAYSGPAFGEGSAETTETLPHDMDHSGDTSKLSEPNQRKFDLLEKVHDKWSSFEKMKQKGWKDFATDTGKRDQRNAESASKSEGPNIGQTLEKFYGQDFKAGIKPEGASVRTELPKTNSELDQFSIEEISIIAEQLAKENIDKQNTKGSRNRWEESKADNILEEVSSQAFKNAISMDRLDRESAANEKERQDLIDAGQGTLDDAPTPTSKDDSDKGGDGKEKTVVEEESNEVNQESDAEASEAEQTKAEELGLVKEGQYYYEDDGQGNADRMTSPVHRVEINGEERFLTSLEDMDGSKEWFEYTEENKGYYPEDKKGGVVSGGNTRRSKKELVNQLQERADLEVEDETSEGGQDSDAEKIESLNLIRDGKNFREMDENGQPDKSGPIIREIEINGEKKYIGSIKGIADADTVWYEHTEENKDSTQKGDDDSTGTTRKDLEAKLQAQADIAAKEASAEAKEGGNTTVETETGKTSVDESSDDTDDTSADTTENIPITEDVRSYMTGLGYKDDQIAGMEEQGLFHPENIRTQTPFEVSDIKNLHNETHFDNYLKDNGIDKQGVEVEGGTPETPTIDENIQTLINTASSDENGTLKHMYEKEYGKDSDFVSFEAFKANKTEEFQKSGEKKTREILGKAQKTMKDLKVKEDKIADKNEANNEKERVQEIKDKKNAEEEAENDIAYGNNEEAQAARNDAHTTSAANLYTHFDEETGDISHETHGEASNEGKHKHIDDHDKKDEGSHPAHHHNEEINKNMPPALRDIEAEQAKGENADRNVISEKRQFLQQKAQEGYMWNHNTNHWIHRENLSGLMGNQVGNNATLANGNHVGKNGKSTFLDGTGNQAQGVFHLGTGYNMHQLGQGPVGKHLAQQYTQNGQFKSHIKSGNLATKFGDSKAIYESSGMGAPNATPKSFGAGIARGQAGAASGFNKPDSIVTSVLRTFGLSKGHMTNDALQQLVDSYSNKNKKI